MHRWAAIDDKKPWELLADKAKSEYNLKKDVSDRSQSCLLYTSPSPRDSR